MYMKFQKTKQADIHKTINPYRNRKIKNSSIALLIIFLVSCNDKEPSTVSTNKGPGNTTIANAKTKTILFFGNSLTAGYGLDPSQAFPALIQQKIDSLQLPYKVVNAGVSGETSSGGNSRITWILGSRWMCSYWSWGPTTACAGCP